MLTLALLCRQDFSKMKWILVRLCQALTLSLRKSKNIMKWFSEVIDIMIVCGKKIILLAFLTYKVAGYMKLARKYIIPKN